MRRKHTIETIGVIPARYASTRLPAKALADIHGKPMIQHVYERASRARELDAVMVATDDQRIVEAVRGFGGLACLTAAHHRSGSERIAEAVAGETARIVVNIQGDEPLIHPEMIDVLASCLKTQPDLSVATLKYRITDPRDIENPNVVKVVTDNNDFALYFSRSPIPNLRRAADPNQVRIYKHIGIYAYTREFLLAFTQWAPGVLEQTEALEQLRILENGYRIKTLESPHNSYGVDTPEDLTQVKIRLSQSPAV